MEAIGIGVKDYKYNKMNQLDLALFVLPLLPSAYLLLQLYLEQSYVIPDLTFYIGMSMFGFYLSNHLIPNIKMYLLRKGISGKDLGKRGTSIADKDIPEACGICSGTIFLICMILCLVKFANDHHDKLLDCNSALLSICFMMFLGFTDDVLDWPWRYKLMLPSIATLPLLCCYEGGTSILVPKMMRHLLMVDDKMTNLGEFLSIFVIVDTNAHGAVLELGLLYFIYMGLLGLFCTNAINIYAGINGLEVGQSYVMACAVLFHNLIEIRNASESSENHLFSAMIMLVFLGVSSALLRHNWYPAAVFVGDTYCYFAGMTFAVSGILGHFSKTLLLFFIPQVINFLWSCPQLFKLVPCPRHRLPKFNSNTGLMEPSKFECKSDQCKWLTSSNTEGANMTLINIFLQLFGTMSEKQLCRGLLIFQGFCCVVGLLFRYNVGIFD